MPHLQRSDRVFGWTRWRTIVPFLGALVLLCALEVATIDILAAVRAYATGESLYSKSQKDAILYLERYVDSGSESDLRKYRAAIAIPLGDRQARTELDRPDPDLQRARAGFLQGGNHPDDIGALIRLYRHFGGFAPMDTAISIWAEGDREIANLTSLADRLHALVRDGDRESGEIRSLSARLQQVNDRLSELERRFSDSLGVAARLTQGVVLGSTLVAGSLLALVSSLLTTGSLRRQAASEKALRESSERWDMAAAAADIGLVDWDVGARRVKLDALAERLFEADRGAQPDEEPGVEVELIERRIHPDDLRRVRASLDRAIATGLPLAMRYRIVTTAGEVRHHELNVRAGRGAGQSSRRMVGILRDVTDVAHREQLRLAKEAAERASAAKTEFLSRMSHELRTPLNAVLGFAQLLLADRHAPLDARQHQRVEHIHRAGTHLLALIDDMLDLVAIESGQDTLEERSVDLATVLEESRRWVVPQARAAGIAIVLENAHANVRADARRLRQVLVNLLSNAVKYNRPGGTVTLSLVPQPDDRWCVLSVRDTGRGLTAEQLSRMFEPFNRLGAEREGIPGTGIGLNIAQRLLERMGGRLEVSSRLGEGSDFRVWLPPGPEDAASCAPAPFDAPPEGVAAHPGRSREPVATDAAGDSPDPLEVLYIEDNLVNLVLMEQALSSRESVRLRTAQTGSDGVAAARKTRPDVLLIDMQLPDFDGLEVLRRVRLEPTLGNVRCIALSANAMPEDIDRARAAGFDDYWTKPIDFARFLAAIDALITQPR